MSRRFTGWHMLAVMLGMFGTIIAVNSLMATLAVRTFGGTVVENSYVASQRFDRWLDEARAQQRLGWTVSVTADPLHRAEIELRAPAGALRGAQVSAVATHPLGRLAQRPLAFLARDGRYVATRPLPAGRWLLRIRVVHEGRTALFDDEIHA